MLQWLVEYTAWYLQNAFSIFTPSPNLLFPTLPTPYRTGLERSSVPCWMLGFPTVPRASTLEKVLLSLPICTFLFLSRFSSMVTASSPLSGWCSWTGTWSSWGRMDRNCSSTSRSRISFLLGMCVWSEPLMAELLEPAQGKLGSRGILVAEVPKTAAWRSPGQEAGSLEGWDPDSWGGLPPASLPPS